MILVTGGAGYIGSHTCVELLSAGYNLVVLDNLCNSHRASVTRIAALANVQLGNARLQFVQGDIRDSHLLDQLLKQHRIEAVLHFAGLKAVGQSVKRPLDYYSNNLQGTLVLLQAVSKYGCKRLVFSSSATVYSNAAAVPIPENA